MELFKLFATLSLKTEEFESGIAKVGDALKGIDDSESKAANAIFDGQDISLRDLQRQSSANASAFDMLADSCSFVGDELDALIKAGGDFGELALIAGMKGGEFAKALGSGAVSALQAFVDGLAGAKNSGNAVVEMLEKIGNSETGAYDGLLRVAEAGSLLAETVKLCGEAWNENTESIKQAGKLYVTTEAELETLKSRAVDAGMSLLEMVQPSLLSAVDDFADGLSWLSENLGIVLPGVSALTVATGGLVSVMNMKSMLTDVTAAWKAFNLVLTATPFGVVNSLVSAMTARILTLWNTNEGFRNAVLNAWEAIKTTAENVWGGIARIFTEDVPNAINNTVKWFSELPGRIWEAIKGISSFGKNVVDGFVQGVKDRIGWAKDSVNSLFSGITSGVKSKLGIASPSKVFAGIGKFTGEGFVQGIESMSGVVDRAMGEVFGARDFAVMPAAVGASLPAAPRSAEVRLGQETQAAGGTAQIIVQNMSVRDDSDIQRIARELYLLQERRRRGMAVLA